MVAARDVVSMAVAKSGEMQRSADLRNEAEVVGDVPRDDGRSAGRRLLKVLGAQLFVVYVAANMMLCAVVFAAWALPRETISGLLGRWTETGTPIQRILGLGLGALVNRLYFWEPNHCVEVFRCEQRAREVLYP